MFQDAREVGIFIKAALHARRLEALGRPHILREQERRLSLLLKAASTTPRWRSLIDLQVSPKEILRALPAVSKAEFMRDAAVGVNDASLTPSRLHAFVQDEERAGKLLDGKYLVATTSGTSGEFGIYINDIKSWAQTRGLLFERLIGRRIFSQSTKWASRPSRLRMSFVIASGGHFMTSLLASRVPPLGRVGIISQVISVEMPMPAIVFHLNQQKPHVLHAYPTMLELLAAEVRAGRL